MRIRDEEGRKITGAQRDADAMTHIMEGMRSWQELSDEVTGPLPGMLCAAIMSGRPELAKLVDPPVVHTPEEMQALYRLIGVLLETNAALQLHASEVAKRAGMLRDALKGSLSTVSRIEDFANFRQHYDD